MCKRGDTFSLLVLITQLFAVIWADTWSQSRTERILLQGFPRALFRTTSFLRTEIFQQTGPQSQLNQSATTPSRSPSSRPREHTLVIMDEGKYPFPSRTRPSSPQSTMVVPPGRGARVVCRQVCQGSVPQAPTPAFFTPGPPRRSHHPRRRIGRLPADPDASATREPHGTQRMRVTIALTPPIPPAIPIPIHRNDGSPWGGGHARSCGR